MTTGTINHRADSFTGRVLSDKERKRIETDRLVRANWVCDQPDEYDDNLKRVYLEESDWIKAHVENGADLVYECKLAGVKPSIRMLYLPVRKPETGENIVKMIFDRAKIRLSKG